MQRGAMLKCPPRSCGSTRYTLFIDRHVDRASVEERQPPIEDTCATSLSTRSIVPARSSERLKHRILREHGQKAIRIFDSEIDRGLPLRCPYVCGGQHN